MADFEKKSDIRRRKFQKRTIYNREQFYDMKVDFTNEDIDITITSSQLTKANISGSKETIQKIIDDLQEAIRL